MINPIRSPPSLLMRLPISYFAFARRFGLTSSAFIERETSSAMKISTPSCFTSSWRMPTCGFARPMMMNEIAATTSTDFVTRFAPLESEASRSNIPEEENFSLASLRFLPTNQKSATVSGTRASQYKYSGCAKRIMSCRCLVLGARCLVIGARCSVLGAW